MADHGLIAAYLRELQYSVARLPDAADIVAEAEDHLREAAERLAAEGLSRSEAEAEAIARFGSAALVAKVCVVESRRGAAVPTSRTRAAGLAAMVTPILLVVGQYLNVTVPSDRGPAHGLGVLLLVAAIPALVFGFWGLRARHGGLGRLGRFAIIAAVVAPFGTFVGDYNGLFLAMGLLGLAVVVLCVAMLHANVLPVVPLVLVAIGPIAVLGLVVGISSAGGDAGPFWAYPMVFTTAGFVWLGWFLWREAAVDGPHSHNRFATA